MLRITTLISAFAFAYAAHAADYTLYVSNERSGDVSVIDAAANSVRATWPIGKRPRGIHVSRDGATLYVAVSGSPIIAPGVHAERAKAAAPDKEADGIAIIDTQSGKVARKLSVGSDPEQFVLTTDERRVIVSNEDESTATAWDVTTGARVFSAPVSEEPEGVALHPTNHSVWVTCEQRGDVFVLDDASGKRIDSFHVQGRPRSVAFSVDGSVAYVPAEGAAEVAVVLANPCRVQTIITIPGPDVLPMCAVGSPDGRFVYVSTGRGNTVAVIDASTNTVTKTIPVGQRPWGIALSPDAQTLYAANGRSNDVSVIDLAAAKEVTRIKVGESPWGITIH
jgi:YVTN family beta-propeller protein